MVCPEAPEPCQLRQRALRHPSLPAKMVIFNFIASILAASQGRRGVGRGAEVVMLSQIFSQNPNAVGLQSHKSTVGGRAVC